MSIVRVFNTNEKSVIDNLSPDQYRMHCIIHEALYPSKQAWVSGTVNSLFFLISLVALNGKVDTQLSRLIITGTVMSKIISTVGTGQKAKQKFVYDNTMHCLLSIRNTHLNTSLTNSIASQHHVMTINNSLGHQYLSSPFMPQLSVPFMSQLSHNTLDISSTLPRDQCDMHQAYSNMMHNRILNGMDG